MKFKFYKHAKEKFKILRKHGLKITQEQVIQTVKSPERVSKGHREPRLVAEKNISKTHKLRVIYEKHKKHIEVVTFYPAQRNHYED